MGECSIARMAYQSSSKLSWEYLDDSLCTSPLSCSILCVCVCVCVHM